MSAEAILWADEDLPLDVTSKAILAKLAAVSDMEDCAWMCVAELAKRVGASERTIQSRLRKLEGCDDAEAYIRPTGRTHRYGTRSVPIYELLVDHDLVAAVQTRRKDRKRAEAERRSMGATVCTHRPEPGAANDTVCTPMGATACTPNEANRESEFANAHSERARAPEGVAEAILAAWPEAHRGRSSVPEIATALRQARKAGAVLAEILAGCAAYAAAPKAWGASGDPMAPHKLIAVGRWSTFAPRSAAAKDSARERVGEAPPAAMRARCVASFGEAKTASYFDPCGWRAADGVLLARTDIGEAWLRKHGFAVERMSPARGAA